MEQKFVADSKVVEASLKELCERVELCRWQDASAQAAREEAMRFAKETRDSVKWEAAETMEQLDAAREALEAETASKQQEIAAAEQQFIANSKVVEDGLKELRERLDARGEQLKQREEIGRASCRERVYVLV